MNVRLRHFVEDDIAQVVELIQNTLQIRDREAIRALIEWRIFQHPYVATEPNRGWVVETFEGRIFGFLGHIAQRFKVFDTERMAGACATYVVAPSHRFWGLALAEKFLKQESLGLLLNTTANEPTRRVFFAFKARELKGQNVLYFWILDGKKFVEMYLARKGMTPALARVVALLAGGGVSLVSWLQRRGLRDTFARNSADAIEIRRMERCDQQIDELWKITEKDYGITLIRDCALLDWALFKYPVRENPTYVLGAYRDGALRGFVALRLYRRSEPRHPRLRMIDLFCGRGDIDMVNALLGASLDLARELKATTLEIHRAGEPLRETIMRWRPRRYVTPGSPYLYKFTDPELQREDAEWSWYPSLLDGDAAP